METSANCKPTRPDVGLIVLAPNAWDSQWNAREQIISRIAKRFHVVWVIPPHEWRDIAARWRMGASVQHPEESIPALVTYRPEPWLPLMYRPHALATFLLKARLRRARSILKARGCRKIVISLWRPQFASVLPLVRHDMSMYHIDDEYSFSPTEVPTSPEERDLMATVDEVFISSPALLDKKAEHCTSVCLTPNGVDYDSFAKECTVPDDLAAIPSPRIGYTGFIKMQLDWDLLHDVARQNPQWSFVFVGRVLSQPGLKEALDRMKALPNVYFLGGKTTIELAAYPQHFDVCMLPYCVNDYTKYLDPLKLGEYMASGRPAVGTPILPLLAVDRLISLADSSTAWGNAIADAMLPAANTVTARADRQDWARARSWDAIVDTITERVERRFPSGHSLPI